MWHLRVARGCAHASALHALQLRLSKCVSEHRVETPGVQLVEDRKHSPRSGRVAPGSRRNLRRVNR
jgi:hypothetical protein